MGPLINRNPATGEALSEIPVSDSASVERAVAEAQAARPAWSALPVDERLECLARVADVLGRQEDELADVITREMGKLRAHALGEVRSLARGLPELLDEIRTAVAPQEFAGEANDTLLVREPLGVVAAITPWNFPLAMPWSILIPALGTGNTVVFKPSEHVPETGRILFEALNEVLPENTIRLVEGGGDVGARLVESDVDMIGFVGSRDTGKKIMAAAASGLKRLVLELGGKDPMVVFQDADLEEAAECAVRHSLRNTGQVCCSVERVYVDETVAEQFEALVVDKARAWNYGDGFDAASKMGPLVSAEQRTKVSTQVDQAVAAGARLLLGGQVPEGPGYFYPATVLAGVEHSAPITHEETFGPVVSLSTFDGDEATAVQLANDTPYGLGANVWTGDAERGMRVARQVRAGQVGVNRYLGGAPGTPWVGARQSGFGFLGGIEGHRQFTTPKSICTPKLAPSTP